MISILCTVSGWPNFFHLHSSEGIYSVLLFAFLRFNSCAPFRLKLPCLAIRSLRTSGKLFAIQRRERLENINFPWRRATFEVLSTSRTAATRILWPGESSSGELTGHLGTTSLVTSNRVQLNPTSIPFFQRGFHWFPRVDRIKQGTRQYEPFICQSDEFYFSKFLKFHCQSIRLVFGFFYLKNIRIYNIFTSSSHHKIVIRERRQSTRMNTSNNNECCEIPGKGNRRLRRTGITMIINVIKPGVVTKQANVCNDYGWLAEIKRRTKRGEIKESLQGVEWKERWIRESRSSLNRTFAKWLGRN